MVLAVAGVVAGATAGIAAHRHKRSKGAPMADASLIVKRLLEEPWKGSFDVIEETVAENYVGHDPSQPEPIRGRDGVKANFQQYIDAFSDARITVDEQFGQGDRVATRWTGRGTHSGEFAGIAATGKEVTISGLTISRLDGDKVVEDWINWDTLGMLVQLGAIPAPARA
jgi:steroid delta-isomerase-like uncharacterized protein